MEDELKEEMNEIISNIEELNEYKDEDFYFQEAVDRLKDLNNKIKNKEELIKKLEEYKPENSYKNYLTSLSDELWEDIDTLDSFIAYCDDNAKSNKGRDNNGSSHYKDNKKRTIARAGVWQNVWHTNVLSYIANNNIEDISSFGIRRAIQYLLDPENHLDILSANHILLIGKKYIKDFEYKNIEELSDEILIKEFDKKIIELFNDVLKDNEILKGVKKKNLTAVYSSIIYQKRHLWDPGKCKDFDKILSILKNNRNLILTGAPGTGKTYLAKQLAKELICKMNENTDGNETAMKERLGFVQFHPSYDYSDFVEGIRPNANNSFERRDGIFVEFCNKAKKDSNNSYVFIIDEINRGEISKIFGELFFSIDPGYRGEAGKVRTQYSNMNAHAEYFYVPENVYIIGTMNDIDRSVESMDFAFRRRFAFYEVKAKDTQNSILQELKMADKDIAKGKMDNLNKCIKECGLTEDYCIGASYFLKVKAYKGNGKWNNLWEYHLKGTLYEYFRGEPDAQDKIEKLRKAYEK